MAQKDETQESDEALADRVKRGENTAFDELVVRYEEKLLRYGRRFLARSEDIEDSVQDVFLRAYMNMQSFKAGERFSPWIYRIAHNAFVNVLRKHAHRSFQFIDFDTFISPLSATEELFTQDELTALRLSIESGLSKIDPKYREVLILHYFEELPYAEIADILQIPKGTVGVRLRRGREALRLNESTLTQHYYGT
jgi:RNA polymerase sigma-70 factor (ECF subfamily)